MTLALVIGILFAAAAVLLVCLAIIDQRALRAEWRRLAALQPDPPARFAGAMVTGLPEPARRYLSHAIVASRVFWRRFHRKRAAGVIGVGA